MAPKSVVLDLDSDKAPLFNCQQWIGLVVALYAKTAGKNSKHAATTEASNISALSHIGLQQYEYLVNNYFQPIPELTAPFQTRQYGLLPPNSILCVLAHMPILTHNCLAVSVDDGQLFRGLRAGKARIFEALKQLRKHKKNVTEDREKDEE